MYAQATELADRNELAKSIESPKLGEVAPDETTALDQAEPPRQDPLQRMGQSITANIAEYAHSKDHHLRRTKGPPTRTRSTPQASPPPKAHPQRPPDPGVEPLLIASGLALTATT